MKPFLENVANPEDASWSMLNRRLQDSIPFEWHHHPEFELTLTLNSRGQRFVGDHIGDYDDGDLVLLGPHLPHTWSSTEKQRNDNPHVALVMWFSPEWAAGLTSNFVELSLLVHMLERSSQGLKFSGGMASTARGRIEHLFELTPADRLLALIALLQDLADDNEAQTLASPSTYSHVEIHGEHARIDRVLAHIHTHYAHPLNLDELAEIAALSASGFHRLFKRHMRMSLLEYISRLRVGEACALLSGTQQPIGHISDVVGYNALANFNRQFKARKGMTPREYRQSMRR